MPKKYIRIFSDMQFHKLDGGAHTNSVSVATPNALVVIENIRYIDSDTMMADVAIVEDEVGTTSD